MMIKLNILRKLPQKRNRKKNKTFLLDLDHFGWGLFFGGYFMEKSAKAHIRSLLWNYKLIRKKLNSYRDVLLVEREVISNYSFLHASDEEWNINQIVFSKMFCQIVSEILRDSTSEVEDIFISKYLKGYPGKANAIVSYETHLSESTVKRRDSEFINELSKRLGWN